MIGQQINQFKILEKLGQGGMGEVYLAEDTRLDRKVALKFLPPHFSQDPDFKARFEHEAKATAALNHPNIITVHDLGQHEGRSYIAMEQVEGRTLEQLISEGDIPLGDAIRYARQICDGLSAAHEAGIVHRDIKPANILIDRKGRVKILDFGLAKSRKATTETRVGTTVGTIQYEAPEQSRGEKVDGRSDLFSLGVVLYEMVTGQRPFKGEFEDAIRYAIANEAPEPMARYKSGVPDELQRIVTKLLEKDPELRYQTASGLMSDLKTLQRDSGPHPSAVHSAVQSGVRPMPQKRGLGRVVIPAVAVVAVLVLLFVFKPWSVDIKPTQEATAAEDKLAVMYFENLADPEDSKRFGSIVANLVISDFSESEYIKVVSSQRLYDILKNLGREGERHISPDVATQVAQRANAKWMVTGTIMQSEPTFAVSAQLVEVSTGNILASPTVRGEPGDEIFDVVDRLTVGIRGELALPAAARDEADPSVKTLTSSSTDAYALYLDGLDLVRQYRFIEAEQKFRAALEIDSTFAMAHFRLALLRTTQWDDFDQGVKHLLAAERFVDNAAEWERLLITGMNHWFAGRLADAQTAFTELIRKYPEEKEGYHQLATFYRIAEGYVDIERAIELNLQLLDLDSLDRNAYNILAYNYDRLGNYQKSIWAIDKYIELSPGQPNPLDSRAELYANNGQTKSALESYLQTIAIDSNFVSAWRGTFHMYVYLGRYADAEDVIAHLKAHSDRDLQFLARQMEVDLAAYRGRLRQAVRLLDAMGSSLGRTGVNRSRLAYVLEWRSGAYSYLGEHRAAREDAERLYELSNEAEAPPAAKDWVLGALIRQAIWEGDRQRVDSIAREHVARFAARSARVPGFDQGRAALFLGRPDSALHYFESWAGEDRDFIQLYWLGQVYAASERLRDAASAFEDAIDRFDRTRWDLPLESNRVQFLLAQVLERSGRPDQAAEQYRLFLDQWKDADAEIDDIKYAKRRLAQIGA